MIRLRPSGADEVLIKRVRDWYEPGPGVFIAPQALFNPALLFTTGVNGTWYDPSDLNTLFQNAAGTTPVTAVEQPVGLMLDKSGRGNHAFNSSGNSANFPVLSARYNLLTKTEDFSDAAWTLFNVSGSATRVGNTFTFGANALDRFAQSGLSLGVINYNASVVLSGSGAVRIFLIGGDGSTGAPTNVTLTSTPTRYTLSRTPAGSGVTGGIGIYNNASGVPSTVTISFPDLRVANDALNQPAYQRVNTATDYDTVGFKPYLKFNGTNQWLQTNSIDFTYGDKMFVCAGVRKTVDTDIGIICEFSASASANNSSFGLRNPSNAAIPNSGFVSRGTIQVVATSPPSYAAPITNVISGIGDISAPNAALRVNSIQVAQSTATQGTGNYGNYPMFVGARAGTSLWFNGRLYGMVVAGKQASTAEITSTETYINQKTGAF